ncbi:MAG: helix-turn-helix transcriptional regulator [Clostridia bacterium]|nr:helix-turn-helix transcriptional regulator [Clostridia bacterium]
MNNIRKYRRYTGTSFNELAKRSGIHPIRLQLIENGDEATMSEIVKIASVLDKPVSKVFPEMKFPKMALTKIVEDTVNDICNNYCKYPDIYNQRFDNEDIAYDIMLSERYDSCPLNDLM